MALPGPFDVNVLFDQLTKLAELNQQLNQLTQLEVMMATMQEQVQEALAIVRAQGTQIDSLNTFVEGMFAQLKDRLNPTPAQQAVLNELQAELKKNDQKIVDAMTEGTVPAGADPQG